MVGQSFAAALDLVQNLDDRRNGRRVHVLERLEVKNNSLLPGATLGNHLGEDRGQKGTRIAVAALATERKGNRGGTLVFVEMQGVLRIGV
jgi:hypothetical protein